MNTSVAEVLKDFNGANRDSLIPILQSIQDKDGYLSAASVD